MASDLLSRSVRRTGRSSQRTVLGRRSAVLRELRCHLAPVVNDVGDDDGSETEDRGVADATCLAAGVVVADGAGDVDRHWCAVNVEQLVEEALSGLLDQVGLAARPALSAVRAVAAVFGSAAKATSGNAVNRVRLTRIQQRERRT